MLKTKQIDLKRKFKAEIGELRMAAQLKCADCLGYFVDPYESCTDKHCPLRRFYPTKGKVQNSQKFRKEMARLAKARDNHPSFVSSIDKLEPSNGLVEV